MLIRCPECELQVSDKAIDCPHCGYPLKPNKPERKRQRSNRRKRLPNGFGQITEIKGRNLRKPFRAMVTTCKDENGKPICKLLQPVAYFSTYNEAYAALLEYNKNPYDLDKGITVKELYKRWSDDYFRKFKSESGSRAYSSAWTYCHAIYNMKVADVRARHIKGCMYESTAEVRGKIRQPSDVVKSKIKSLFNLMLDYAVEYEIVEKNYARTFNISEKIINAVTKAEKEHIAFSDKEMLALWNNSKKLYYADIVLIQCYSGWRPQELGLIKLSDVDLDNWTFKGGMKTEAGFDRIVPIHPKIRDLVKKKYIEAKKLNSDYLFNCIDCKTKNDIKLTYGKYQKRFHDIMNELNLNKEHRPHDPRKFFITTAKKYNMNEFAIKYIVGHAIDDITESVYTVRELSWLQQEMEKIK